MVRIKARCVEETSSFRGPKLALRARCVYLATGDLAKYYSILMFSMPISASMDNPTSPVKQGLQSILISASNYERLASKYPEDSLGKLAEGTLITMGQPL